ncbi:hypothetical protein MRX96_057755 [Rhipicephalus microplus]
MSGPLRCTIRPITPPVDALCYMSPSRHAKVMINLESPKISGIGVFGTESRLRIKEPLSRKQLKCLDTRGTITTRASIMLRVLLELADTLTCVGTAQRDGWDTHGVRAVVAGHRCPTPSRSAMVERGQI